MCLAQILLELFLVRTFKISVHVYWIVVICRDAKRPTKKSAKPSNFNFLTNQRPATEILTNGITWREIHFGFWTNQRTIKSLLASLSYVNHLNLHGVPSIMIIIKQWGHVYTCSSSMTRSCSRVSKHLARSTHISVTVSLSKCPSVKDKPLERTSILGPKTASFYSSARLASVFWSSTRLGILDFSAGLRILGSEYSTFGRPSNTRLGILDFSADLRILGSEYSTFFAELPSVITI